MPASDLMGTTPTALQLAALEPFKFRRKRSVFLPLGIVILFALWAGAVMLNSPVDDRSPLINIAQLGGLMLPLLIGSVSLILAGEDKNTGMMSRTRSFGITVCEIGLSKALWVLAISLSGLLALTLATVITGHSAGMSPPANAMVIALFALVAEIVSLAPAFLNLAFRKRGQGYVLALSLGGALLGSAGHFLPRYAAALTPFTFAGALSPARIDQGGIHDASYSLLLPIIVVGVSIIVCAVSVVFFPRRVPNE